MVFSCSQSLVSCTHIHVSRLVRPQLPPNYEDETWERLKRAVHAIHNHEKVPESLETLYKVHTPFFMCINMTQRPINLQLKTVLVLRKSLPP
jgi:hypothetical protein